TSERFGGFDYTREVGQPTVGFPWLGSSQLPSVLGREQLRQGFNQALGDSATMHPEESLSGYNTDPLGPPPNGPVYAYRRYNNQKDQAVLASLSAGGVTIASNPIAGGSLFAWTHNNVQFVSKFDYGRQIATALFPNDCTNINEPGDLHSVPCCENPPC